MIGFVEPCLVDVDDALSSLKQSQLLFGILLSKYNIPLGVGLVIQLLGLDKTELVVRS